MNASKFNPAAIRTTGPRNAQNCGRPAGKAAWGKPEVLVRASHPAILTQFKAPKAAALSRDDSLSGSLPDGYELIDASGYVITPRDLVFIGGDKPRWVLARRAGESGEMIRFSTAHAVARPSL